MLEQIKMTVLRRAALPAAALAMLLAGPANAQTTQDYPAPIDVLPTTIDRAPEPEPEPQPAPAAIELPRTGVDAGMLAAVGVGTLAAGALSLRRRRS